MNEPLCAAPAAFQRAVLGGNVFICVSHAEQPGAVSALTHSPWNSISHFAPLLGLTHWPEHHASHIPYILAYDLTPFSKDVVPGVSLPDRPQSHWSCSEGKSCTVPAVWLPSLMAGRPGYSEVAAGSTSAPSLSWGRGPSNLRNEGEPASSPLPCPSSPLSCT